MAQVKITGEKILSDEYFKLKRVDFDIQKKNGEWENQQREVYDHGNAVTALLYNKEAGTVLLTKQFRIATYVNGNNNGMLTETCAGILEDGEAPDEAMIREIKEETGYAVSSVQKVYEAYTSAGSLNELLYFYVAPYTKDQKVEKGGGLEEEGEELRIIEMPFAEAIDRVEKGEIKDAKTIMLLQYAQLKQLL